MPVLPLPSSVRPMTGDDLDWLVATTRARRESLVPHAPRFWRPAADAAARHRDFLAHLLENPAVLSVRTPGGYLIAFERGPVWIVDDLAVTAEGGWAHDGVTLLRHAQQACGALRVVVPVAEVGRYDAARTVGLRAVEQWWHRDLPAPAPDPDPDTVAGPPDDETTLAVGGAVGGAAGRLVPAPPVYDPGGPLLLVTEPGSGAALAALEAAAALRGATVSVVTHDPADGARADLLTGAGYTLTTAFCETP